MVCRRDLRGCALPVISGSGGPFVSWQWNRKTIGNCQDQSGCVVAKGCAAGPAVCYRGRTMGNCQDQSGCVLITEESAVWRTVCYLKCTM
jgi:hypothetical protein